VADGRLGYIEFRGRAGEVQMPRRGFEGDQGGQRWQVTTHRASRLCMEKFHHKFNLSYHEIFNGVQVLPPQA
jgi:hypothetical protein